MHAMSRIKAEAVSLEAASVLFCSAAVPLLPSGVHRRPERIPGDHFVAVPDDRGITVSFQHIARAAFFHRHMRIVADAGTGSMEIADAVFGIAGYICMYLVLYLVVALMKAISRKRKHPEAKKSH